MEGLTRLNGHTDVEELVVLLDERLRPVGTAPKAEVHTTTTPLHLAFSCYVFDDSGRLLLSRRAPGKRAWPGVWTNSFCGHPAPGEQMADAVTRRARRELGLGLAELRMVLPDFRYRAVAADGVVENEFCPVWTARAVGEPQPAADEVSEWRWVPWTDLLLVAERMPFLLSPWAQLQISELAVAG